VIVVVGRVSTDAQRREELVRIAKALTRASRQEPGCIGYRFYEDTEAANDFVFVEEWQDEDALRSHFATAHIAAFMSSAPAALLGPPDVKFHTVAATRDISEMA